MQNIHSRFNKRRRNRIVIIKKARKSKFVIGGVALLSCVALAGVGYSSWVITSTVTSKTGNVSVTASDIEDDRITIGDISVTGSYSFGPSTDTSGGLISASDSNTSEESLSVTFSFTVSCADSMTFGSLTKSYNITLALASDKTCDSEGTVGIDRMDALAYATDTNGSHNYLAAPATGLVGSTGITIATVTSTGVTSNYSSGNLQVLVDADGTSSPATVTVTAAFGWGTYFGEQNPVNLSNEKYLDDYIEGLEWLNKAFNKAQFNYTIGGAIQTTETENTETNSD